MSFGIEFEGGRQFRAALKDAGIKIGDLTKINRAAANIVAQRGIATAPRRKGKLAASIKAAGGARKGVVVSKLPYANAVHWGWPKRGISRNPWLARAAKNTEPRWLQLYTAELDQLLKRLETTP